MRGEWVGPEPFSRRERRADAHHDRVRSSCPASMSVWVAIAEGRVQTNANEAHFETLEPEAA